MSAPRAFSALAMLLVASVFPCAAAARSTCSPTQFAGRVKSITETLLDVDRITGKPVLGTVFTTHINISADGLTIESTFENSTVRSRNNPTIADYYDTDRKLLRSVERSDGKRAYTTTLCSYDGQGRLLEIRIISDNYERSIVQTYEYGPGFRRVRARFWGAKVVATETLDARGRAIKSVTEGESPIDASTVDSTYEDDRVQKCYVSFLEPERKCGTIVFDSHGNEIETRSGDRVFSRTSYEYDAMGNWTSQRIAHEVLPNETTDMLLTRAIEYWK